MSNLDEIDAIFEINAAGTTWGSITGDIEDQADLKEALDSITGDIGDLDSIVGANYDELDGKIDDNHTEITNHVTDTNNPHAVTKAQVGLGNVNNTSDLDKPISTATQTALDGKVPTSRTINDKPLTGNIELTAADVGALSSSTTINDLTTTAQRNALNSGVTASNFVNVSGAQTISGVKTFTAVNNTFEQQVLLKNTALLRYTNGSVNSRLIGKESSAEPGSGYVRLGNKSDTTIVFGHDARPQYCPYAIGYTSDTNISNAVDLALYTDVTGEASARETADNDLQSQIDAITSASDVTDIVGTYAALQAYDTTHLPNNSIIEVLKDEHENNKTTYYRWVISGGVGSWVLIGSEGPYYTISAADSTFVPKTRTVNGKALSSNITLTASDVGALSTITSANVISALGYTPVNKAGDTMSGILKIQKTGMGYDYLGEAFDFTTTPTGSNVNAAAFQISDINDNRMARLEYTHRIDGSHTIALNDKKNNSEAEYASIAIGWTSDSVPYTTAVTPPSNSNGTNIATTAWVRNFSANQNLSNVSSISSSSAVYTALAGKQDTLESGTNIKTLNGADIIGAGNIDVANITLSNISSIDPGSAVQTALDYKVNKSGDTMTGDLNIYTGSISPFKLRKTNDYSTQTTNGSTYQDIIFQDYTGNRRNVVRSTLDWTSDGTSSTLSKTQITLGTCGMTAHAPQGLQVQETANGITVSLTGDVLLPASSNAANVATTKWIKDFAKTSGTNYMSTFSKATNGYYKFTNGLILQWGTNSVNNTTTTITLPTAFTSSNYCVSATGSNNETYSLTERTTTAFKIAASSSVSTQWMAIGY